MGNIISAKLFPLSDFTKFYSRPSPFRSSQHAWHEPKQKDFLGILFYKLVLRKVLALDNKWHKQVSTLKVKADVCIPYNFASGVKFAEKTFVRTVFAHHGKINLGMLKKSRKNSRGVRPDWVWFSGCFVLNGVLISSFSVLNRVSLHDLMA